MALNKKFFIGGGVDLDATTYYNGATYSGNSSTQSITGLGFQPDLTWCQWRSGSTSRYPLAFDSVRGATTYSHPNDPAAENTVSTSLTSFDSDGFSLGSWVGMNQTGSNWMTWNFNAGNNVVSGSGTNASSIQKTENTDFGFGIYKFTTTSSSNTNVDINHSLNSTPEFHISKVRSRSGSWYVWHKDFPSTTSYLRLQSTDDVTSFTNMWGNGHTSSSIGFRTDASCYAGEDHILYAWHSIDGVQKVGSYTGNATADHLIQTGFRPRFVLLKGDNNYNWVLFDSTRGDDKTLLPNNYSTGEISSSTSWGWHFRDNGFELTSGSNIQYNGSGTTYYYIAIA